MFVLFNGFIDKELYFEMIDLYLLSVRMRKIWIDLMLCFGFYDYLIELYLEYILCKGNDLRLFIFLFVLVYMLCVLLNYKLGNMI